MKHHSIVSCQKIAETKWKIKQIITFNIEPFVTYVNIGNGARVKSLRRFTFLEVRGNVWYSRLGGFWQEYVKTSGNRSEDDTFDAESRTR
jgi:hypothetical protein